MGGALLGLAVAGGDLAVGGGLGAGVAVAFGGGGLVGSAGVVCAGAVALDVGSRKPALDAPGGRMNLLYAGAWAAAMALARSSGLLVRKEFPHISWFWVFLSSLGWSWLWLGLHPVPPQFFC